MAILGIHVSFRGCIYSYVYVYMLYVYRALLSHPFISPALPVKELNHGFLHRLDVPSSGLILAAKNSQAYFDLRLQLLWLHQLVERKHSVYGGIGIRIGLFLYGINALSSEIEYGNRTSSSMQNIFSKNYLSRTHTVTCLEIRIHKYTQYMMHFYTIYIRNSV